jgi:amino acid adenylation domain-containing protein
LQVGWDYNKGSLKMAYLLQKLLTETAVKHPQKTAAVFSGETITYNELDQKTDFLANQLISLGVKKGDRVGIFLEKSIASIISVFGVLKAGAVYVPIDPMAPLKYINYIITQCHIKVLLTFQQKLNKIEKAFPEDSTLENILVMNKSESNQTMLGKTKLIYWPKNFPPSMIRAPKTDTIDRDLAYILFTSGSTGNPKGVMISHLNSLTYVNAAFDFFTIGEDDKLASHAPLHFDLSVFDIFCAIKAGATIVIMPESSSIFPTKIAEFISDNRITVWNSVPSVLSLLATNTQLENYNFSTLRVIQFAGEVFPIKYLKRLKEVIPQAKYYNVYGQTEANSSLYYPINQLPEKETDPIPIGKTFPNFNVFALDDHGNLVSRAGEKGELFINASTVAYGYWGDTERTEKNFVKNPLNPYLNERVYRTGDLVTIDSDGNYTFLGRKDFMIKSRGYRIEIGQIETVLLSHSEIKDAVVIPIPDELIGNRITAVIVPLNKNKFGKAEVAKYCSKQLPRYMIPEIFEFRDTLPKTSSGKTDRRKLTEVMNQIITISKKED